MCTNTLVKYTIDLLSAYDRETEEFQSVPEIMPFYPEPLKMAMETMRRVIQGIGWVSFGDVRANVIEPILGYSLRQLEMDLQPGMGVGHGFIGIFEIRK